MHWFHLLHPLASGCDFASISFDFWVRCGSFSISIWKYGAVGGTGGLYKCASQDTPNGEGVRPRKPLPFKIIVWFTGRIAYIPKEK